MTAIELLSRALRDPGRVAWRPAAAVLGDHALACIDGRHDDCAVSAPGGNAGELLLALAVVEWFRRTPYRDDELDVILDAVAAGLGPLYLHTDEHARDALAAALSIDPAEVVSPTAELRPRLLELIAEPAFLGCGHLQAMATAPDAYRVRRGLVTAVVRGLYQRAWDQRGAALTVLEGEHHEHALVVFHTPDHVDDDTLLPSLCGRADARFFTSNQPALRLGRARLLDLISAADPAWTPRDRQQVLLEIERLGERQLDLTIARLAPELPRYRVTFDGRGALAVDFCESPTQP